MNILFFNHGYIDPITGGVSKVSYYLYRYLKHRGHQVTLLSWMKNPHPLPDSLSMPDADMVLSPDNKNLLDKVLKEKKIDLVLSHTGNNPNLAPAIKYVAQQGVKVVTIDHAPPYGLYGYRMFPELVDLRSAFLRKLADLMIRYAYVVKYRRLTAMQTKYSERIVMLSDTFIPEYLTFSGKKYRDKLMSIPNPITVEAEPRVEKENILLFVGRLVKGKGIHYLLQAWRLLEEQYPSWKLQIVGDGSERELAERIIKKYSLKRCELLGFQQPEYYYNCAKIFCMTSTHESFGLVLVEAMLYGTVPVAFQSYPNITDIIDHGVNGMLVPPFDVKAYAAQLAELMNDPAYLQQMSDEAVRKSEFFSIEKVGARWEQLFDELLMK